MQRLVGTLLCGCVAAIRVFDHGQVGTKAVVLAPAMPMNLDSALSEAEVASGSGPSSGLALLLL